MEALKAKRRRQRLNPTHRWTSYETQSLLNTILEELKAKPQSFEQPTAYEFYKRIAAKTRDLKGIDLRVYRSKMRNLKTNYIKATWMKRTQHLDSAAEENIKNLCPFWNLLHKIFAHTRREKPQNTEIQIQAAEEPPSPDLSETIVELSNNMIEIPKKIKMPIKILGRPRNSSKNIAALSRLIEMHDDKLQFETFKWQKQQKYNDKQLELEHGEFEMRLMECEEEFERKKEEIMQYESDALQKIKFKVALLERIRIQELAFKLGQ